MNHNYPMFCVMMVWWMGIIWRPGEESNDIPPRSRFTSGGYCDGQAFKHRLNRHSDQESQAEDVPVQKGRREYPPKLYVVVTPKGGKYFTLAYDSPETGKLIIRLIDYFLLLRRDNRVYIIKKLFEILKIFYFVSAYNIFFKISFPIFVKFFNYFSKRSRHRFLITIE